MKKWMSMMMVMGLLSFVAMGCGGDDTDGNGDDTPASDTGQADSTPTPPVTPVSLMAGMVICGDCSHDMKKEDAETHECDTTHVHEACDKCKLPKGMALCCIGLMAEDAKGVKFCGDCGKIADGKDCCNDDPACTKCGMHKGSALCCQIKPKS